MIMARNEDGTYSQVGFVKDNVGIDTEYIYDKDGDIVFEKGFTRETSGTVPLTINGIGKDLKSWSITGNTVQNGTPTPENPVEVQAVGDRTANLYLWNGNLLGSSGLTVSENKSVISSVVDVRGINTVYFTGDKTLLNSSVYRISKSDTPIEVGSTVKAFDSSFVGGVYDVSDCNYLLVTASVYNKPQENIEIIKNTFMLNLGSTPLPYEPYGYKIPVVTSADGAEPITTPIYLPTPLYSGEVMRSDGTITRSDGTTETFTSPQIPTLNGTTVIDVDTAVKPESITIKYKAV